MAGVAEKLNGGFVEVGVTRLGTGVEVGASEVVGLLGWNEKGANGFAGPVEGAASAGFPNENERGATLGVSLDVEVTG